MTLFRRPLAQNGLELPLQPPQRLQQLRRPRSLRIQSQWEIPGRVIKLGINEFDRSSFEDSMDAVSVESEVRRRLGAMVAYILRSEKLRGSLINE